MSVVFGGFVEMGSGEEEIGSWGLCDVENTIFVAVGKNVKESKSTLFWALQSFPGKIICLLHVHQPAHLVTLIDGKSSLSKLKQHAAKAYHELERQRMHKLLDQYHLIIDQAGVKAAKVWIEMDNVEKGILQVVAQRNVRRLVMGGAADKHYSVELSELKSKKAIFVCQQAPPSCHVWFACNGCLIFTRPRYCHVSSNVGSITVLSSPTVSSGMKLVESHADVDEETDEVEGMSGRFTSKISVPSTKSTEKTIGTLQVNSLSMHKMRGDGSLLPFLHKSQDDPNHSSPIVSLEEKSAEQATSEISDKLEHAEVDPDNSEQKEFEESVSLWKAEEDTLESIYKDEEDCLSPESIKAEELDSLCMKEIKQRKEMEEVLARQRQNLDQLRNQHDQYARELQAIRDQKPILENQLVESQSMEEELVEKIIQAVNLLETFKEKRDKLKFERDNTIREINETKKLVQKDAQDSFGLQFFAFSFWEINEATRDFDPSWKIGDGIHGSVYKGFLCHLKVAIKMLPSHSSRGHMEFENEAHVLSRVRHPHLVNLVGTCPESRSLVYEYLANGSLEDCLACQGKTPLSWQTRIRIASEICSALVFLHSNRPCIIHGNLKATNILLDANFVSKIGDVGIYQLISKEGYPTHATTLLNNADPEASAYVDPEFLETGELTVESDVYSFGVILLRVLTGRPAAGVVKDVKCALERENLNTVLELTAGDWPLEQAKTLACLALRCCDNKKKNRPDLVSQVGSTIELLDKSCTSSNHDSNESRRVPSHFTCPIFQEVMKDPHIAADGFTYEADAIKGWLNSGAKTSPMTNLNLDHLDLLPNHALYYAIQEWHTKS
ncbi:U-box domain-containing protein 32-like isoform X2 [Diospyros lotus]|uniref:U-box domain-containing protein 32-like isoform X2 n=1 Tax=Diospyros lotus TaxID=55363 RepID=UPI002258ECE5|nr:U-box domain-containing protein 32-like isoform X2 [Diospyros lotus]